MEKKFDLAIVGAGIMGMGCALEAARVGMRVVIFDPTPLSEKASWAAAGILVTRDAQTFLSPFREFYVRSIHLYPQWLREISILSGMTVSLNHGGDFQVYDLSYPKSAQHYQAKLKQLDREHSRNFTIEDRLPPFLSKHSPLQNVKALHFPAETYVQNRELLTALSQACENVGVHRICGEPNLDFKVTNGKTRIQFAEGELETHKLILTAGTWTGKILENLGLSAPMIPVKGQMIRIQKFYAENCMVHFNEDLYLVPRGDSLIVGATTEAGVWQEGFDERGETYLRQHLERLLPAIAREPMEEWSGLRPRTRDRLPWMGWIDSERGWAICTGHYKCGISMAPLAAQSMTKLIRGEKPQIDLEPFNPWRRQGLSRLSLV